MYIHSDYASLRAHMLIGTMASAHRDYGTSHSPDVCCRQAQIYKQCCFATLTNNKSHALASELAGMAFIIRDHYVVTVYISELGSLSLIFYSSGWFWCIVEEDSVDTWYFGDDSIYKVINQFVGEMFYSYFHYVCGVDGTDNAWPVKGSFAVLDTC